MIKSSGSKTASGIISAQPCKFFGATLVGSAETSTLTIYDNAASATGTAIAITKDSVILPIPIRCANGIYASLTDTGNYIVYYMED